MIRDVSTALKLLEQYFDIQTSRVAFGDLLPEGLSSGNFADGNLKTYNDYINKYVIDSTTSFLTLETLVNRLSSEDDATKEKLKKLINVYWKDNEKSFVANGRSAKIESLLTPGDKKQGKDDTLKADVGVITIETPRSLPAVRHTSAVSLFINSIPTLEFSRAVPYLDVRIVFPSNKSEMSKEVYSNMSLLKFLNGSEKISGDADKIMINASPISDPFSFSNNKEEKMSLIGMELFAAPQTLVNYDTKSFRNSALRIAPIADPTRPFMTLEGVDIDLVGTRQLMSNKTANLGLILHDRSRLGEIAQLIRPDFYNRTSVIIEYGWSHPDVKGDSAFGALLNSMRVVEKFMVVNSDFQFDESGQVKIKLSLSMMGGTEMHLVKIDADAAVKSKMDEANQISKAISLIRDNLQLRTQDGNDQTGSKEIRGYQLLDAAEAGDYAIEQTPDFKKAYKDLLNSLENNKLKSNKNDADLYLKLKEELVKLYGSMNKAQKNKSPSIASTIKRVLKENIQQKRKIINSTDDPFLLQDYDFHTGVLQKNRDKYVSLGKLLYVFVINPLAAAGKFDEVQLISYDLNHNAGAMRSLSLVNIPFNKDLFFKEYDMLVSEMKRDNLTIKEFIAWIQSKFLDDMSLEAYGLSKPKINTIKSKVSSIDESQIGPDGQIPEGAIVTNEVTSKVADPYKRIALEDKDELKKRVDELGLPNGTYLLPKFEIYIESMPYASLSGADSTRQINEGKTILRLHLFDRVASPYPGQFLILEALQNDIIKTYQIKDTTKQNEKYNEQASAFLAEASSRGLISYETTSDKQLANTNVIVPKVGFEEIKKFMKSTVPSITYGKENSAIISAGLKSLTDAKLTTTNMMRSGFSNPLEPNNGSTGNLPLRVIPAQLDIEMLGCPLISFGQQFFVDMGTGTTLDDIYTCSKVSHKISQGKFMTTMTLTPAGSAYGSYETFMTKVKNAASLLDVMVQNNNKMK